MHKHHIIPRHMGGTDDPDNLIEVTVEQHAELHRRLWKAFDKWEDKIAWQMLSGQIGKEEAIKESQRLANLGNKHFANKTHSPKVRASISAKQKVSMLGNKNALGKHQFSKDSLDRCRKTGSTNGRAKAVICDGVEYPTMKEAAEKIGVSRDVIRNRILRNIYWYK